MSWDEKAKCRGMDTDLFFPESGAASVVAKRMCDKLCLDCPVKQQCLEIGLASDVQVGFFGGLSAKQRQRILSERYHARLRS
jgi:WhiB family redox-sensing transcriptional regulator